MPTANKDLVYRWFEEVWNKKRKSAIAEMVHSAAVVHGLPGASGQPIRGPEGFLPFWQQFSSAFPDIQVHVETIIEEGETLAARCRVRGTHLGPELGKPPTRAAIDFTGICMLRMKDGKIFEAWNSFDFLLFYQQIGIVARNL